MPLQHCFGLYDEQKIAPAAWPSACKYPKEPVNGSSPHYLIDRMKLDGPHLAFHRETCELVHTR